MTSFESITTEEGELKLMWTKKKKMWYIAYKLFAAWLPVSRHSILARHTRLFYARKIADYCGKNVNIERNASFSPELHIGENSGIGIDCEINGKVFIGDNVMMGPEVIIYTRNHRYDRVDIPIQLQGYSKAEPVHIGDDVWIGRRAIILPGVTIGNGCVVGAGAVVTKDIPAYSVAVGVPARVVKERK